MNDIHFENSIISEAIKISLPNPISSLFDCQISYWLSLQSLMKSSGFEEVKIKFPHITEQFAEKIAQCSYIEISKICTSQMSTLRPSLPEESILNLIADSNNHNRQLNALQLLAS